MNDLLWKIARHAEVAAVLLVSGIVALFCRHVYEERPSESGVGTLVLRCEKCGKER